MGLRAALAPSRAPAGAASRAALVAATVAVAGIVAVGVFATSLTRLLHHRHLQGWSFDVAISREGDATAALDRELAGIDGQPGVAAHGLATVVAVEHGRARYEAFAFDRAGLALHPTLRSGRRPRADDETVVGRDALTRLGADVGDTVVLRGPKGRTRLRVVGTAAYPELGNDTDVATGISMTLAAARRIGAPTVSTLALVRVDGTNGYRVAARHRGDGELVRAFRPPRVKSLEEVGSLPTVLAVFLGLLGLVAVAHGMRRSSRERRHDFALLATLGVVRSGLRSIVAWQSLAIACVAIVVGVPVGAIAGRAAWSAVADATGVVDEVAVPAGMIAAVVATTVVACLVIGRVSARQAIRPDPAVVLRSG
jgi:putative ABC transport system permease protein